MKIENEMKRILLDALESKEEENLREIIQLTGDFLLKNLYLRKFVLKPNEVRRIS